MKQLIYVMQFTGQAAPAAGSTTVIKATSTASSCSLTTTVGASGVSGVLQPVGGDKAHFESEVTLTGDASFLESGSIRFGERNSLRFSTVGQGNIGASADPKLKSGTVMWRVDGGEGQFAGASGYITSNFLIGEAGELTDNHFGVLFVN
jgi:hypothetical protein